MDKHIECIYKTVGATGILNVIECTGAAGTATIHWWDNDKRFVLIVHYNNGRSLNDKFISLKHALNAACRMLDRQL